MVRVWSEELLEFDLGTVQAAATDYCRKNPSQWCPSLDQMRAAIIDTRGREQARLALPEPEVSPEERARNLDRIRTLQREVLA